MTNTPKIYLHNQKEKKCQYAIKITSAEGRFEIVRKILKPSTFKTTHNEVT